MSRPITRSNPRHFQRTTQAEYSPAQKFASKTNIVAQSNQLRSLENRSVCACRIEQFQQTSGLADLHWLAVHQSGFRSWAEAQQRSEGVVVFLHGCNGSHAIWEDLPARLVEHNPGLLCLSPDLPGHGQSPFLGETAARTKSDMPTTMQTIEAWLALIGLHPQQNPNKFYLFIGHSMGGGLLFYKQQAGWENTRYGCYQIGPSLHTNDLKRRKLYRLTAFGMRLPYILPLQNFVTRCTINSVMRGASRIAKETHQHFMDRQHIRWISYALQGISDSPRPSRTDWSQYHIVMGSKDRAVSTKLLYRLAMQLGFTRDQIELLDGDHYFYSYDQDSPLCNWDGRQKVLRDLLAFCDRLAA